MAIRSFLNLSPFPDQCTTAKVSSGMRKLRPDWMRTESRFGRAPSAGRNVRHASLSARAAARGRAGFDTRLGGFHQILGLVDLKRLGGGSTAGWCNRDARVAAQQHVLEKSAFIRTVDARARPNRSKKAFSVAFCFSATRWTVEKGQTVKEARAALGA